MGPMHRAEQLNDRGRSFKRKAIRLLNHIFRVYSVAEVLVFLISWFDVTLPSDQNPPFSCLDTPAKSELADTYGSGTVLRYCIYHTLGGPGQL